MAVIESGREGGEKTEKQREQVSWNTRSECKESSILLLRSELRERGM